MKYKLKSNTIYYAVNIYNNIKLKYINKKRLEYIEHSITFSDKTNIVSNNHLHVGQVTNFDNRCFALPAVSLFMNI